MRRLDEPTHKRINTDKPTNKSIVQVQENGLKAEKKKPLKFVNMVNSLLQSKVFYALRPS